MSLVSIFFCRHPRSVHAITEIRYYKQSSYIIIISSCTLSDHHHHREFQHTSLGGGAPLNKAGGFYSF